MLSGRRLPLDENVGERAVRAPPLGVGGRLVDRGPHQRMMEHQAARTGSRPDRPARPGRAPRPEHRACRRRQHCGQARRLVGGRHQQQPLRRARGGGGPAARKCAGQHRSSAAATATVPDQENWPGVIKAGSSTSASGLPPVASIRRLSTSGGIATPTRSASSCPPASASSPSTCRSGSPGAENRRTSPSRAAKSRAIRSASIRRATNSRAGGRRIVEPLGVVDHAEHRRSRANSSRIPRTATDTRKRLSWPFAARPNAIPSALRLRRGKPIDVAQHRSEQLVQRGERQLKLRLDTCRAEDPHFPRQRRRRHRGVPDLPAPARPRRTSTPPRAARAPSSSALIADRSRSLPYSIRSATSTQHSRRFRRPSAPFRTPGDFAGSTTRSIA